VTTWRLRDLTLPGRLGVTCLLLVIAGGLWASMEHLEDHHENRDSKPGVSLNDLKGAYHGVWLPPALESALNRNHPESLPEADKTNLLKWLKSKSPNELYDEPVLGAEAPAEILARNCVSCHGRKSTDPSKIGETMPLEFWDDVKKVVFPTVIDPVPTKILVASAHAHLLAMATLVIAVLALLFASRWSAAIKGWVTFVMCVGLLGDFSAQWLARGSVEYVYVLIASGGLYVASSGLALFLVALEFWMPRGAD